MKEDKLRTISQQEYRDKFAELLGYLRKSGHKDLATNLLEKRKNSQEYIDAKEGTDKTILQQLKRSLLLPFYVLEKNLPSVKKMRKREQEEIFNTLEEEQKEKKNREKKEIIEYALNNSEDGEVIMDYEGNYLWNDSSWDYEGNIDEKKQKYILVVEPTTMKLKFISKNFRFHKYILEEICPNGFCLGGGRITMENTRENKTITLFGRSGDYGGLQKREMECAIKLLKKHYPNYTIVAQ